MKLMTLKIKMTLGRIFDKNIQVECSNFALESTNSLSNLWAFLNIYITTCEFYKNREKLFLEENKNLLKPLKLTELQKQNEFYKSHFFIVQTNFRGLFDRLKSVAFYMRMFRPDLNIQVNTQKYFKLF
jgi:hypothetical protein